MIHRLSTDLGESTGMAFDDDDDDVDDDKEPHDDVEESVEVKEEDKVEEEEDWDDEDDMFNIKWLLNSDSDMIGEICEMF